MIKQLQALVDTSAVKPILAALKPHTEVFLVGGAVRDLLAGQPDVYDLDFACKLRPETIKDILEAAQIRVVPTGIEHGTVTAVSDYTNFEFTTFRAPSSRLSTEFSETIEEDLAGRDFTINSIAYSIEKEELIDPFNGVSDLENKIIRATCHAEARLAEDPLRILRLVRFGPAENRTVETKTLDAAISLKENLEQVSVERIREEFCKILMASNPTAGIRAVRDFKLLEYVLPELTPAVDCQQNKYHVEDVFEHTMTVLSRTPEDLLLRLTAIFHDIGKPHTISVDEEGERHFYQHEHVGADICTQAMKRLKFSKELTQSTTKLVDYHMRPLNCSPAAVRRLMRDLGPLLREWRLFKYADKSPLLSEQDFSQEAQGFDQMLQEELNRRDLEARSKLVISGHDMMELGIPAGPILGKVIAQLKEMILDTPELNTKEKLTQLAREIFEELNN